MNLSSTGRVDATLAFVGLLLALPAIYFFTGSFLKYEMNLLSNIEIIVFSPSVLIGGLLVAIVLNLFSLFRLKSTTSLEFTAAVVIREKTLNIAIAQQIHFIFQETSDGKQPLIQVMLLVVQRNMKRML